MPLAPAARWGYSARVNSIADAFSSNGKTSAALPHTPRGKPLLRRSHGTHRQAMSLSRLKGSRDECFLRAGNVGRDFGALLLSGRPQDDDALAGASGAGASGDRLRRSIGRSAEAGPSGPGRLSQLSRRAV